MSSTASASAMHFLDLFPLEICERVALHVSNGQRSTSLLALAQTSPKQRTAVSAALSKKLTLDCFSATASENAAWANLLKDVVVELEMNGYDLAAVEDISHPEEEEAAAVLRLLQAPTLRRVHVVDDPVVLHALASSTSLRELHIKLTTVATFDVFLASLELLQLTKLTIDCSMADTEWWEIACPFEPPTRNAKLAAMAAACSGLTSFEMSCYCVWDQNETLSTPLWEMLPLLPKLREAVCYSDAPERMLPLLRGLDSVVISAEMQTSGNEWAPCLAARVGSSVTSLHCIFATFSASQVASLAKCPRLRSIRMKMECGAEEVLSDVICGLPQLEALHISWNSAEECVHDGERPHPCHHAAKPGTILRIVRRAPNLKKFTLRKVRVKIAEMRDVLESLGGTVRLLHLDDSGQDEAPLARLARLESLLYTVNRFNRGLETLRVDGLWPISKGVERAEDVEWVRQIFRLLRRLQQNTPRFNVIQVSQGVERFLDFSRIQR